MPVLYNLYHQPCACAPERVLSPGNIIISSLDHIGPAETAATLLHRLYAGRGGAMIENLSMYISCFHQYRISVILLETQPVKSPFFGIGWWKESLIL